MFKFKSFLFVLLGCALVFCLGSPPTFANDRKYSPPPDIHMDYVAINAEIPKVIFCNKEAKPDRRKTYTAIRNTYLPKSVKPVIHLHINPGLRGC